MQRSQHEDNYNDVDAESVEAQASQGSSLQKAPNQKATSNQYNKGDENQKRKNSYHSDQAESKIGKNDQQENTSAQVQQQTQARQQQQQQQDLNSSVQTTASSTVDPNKTVSLPFVIQQLKDQGEETINQLLISLNQRLNLMSQMPNNNIGLALIFRRFRMMDLEQQQQFCFNIFQRFDEILLNATTQIQASRHNLDAAILQEKQLEADKITSGQQQVEQVPNPQLGPYKQQWEENITEVGGQLIALFRITKRIAYNCPLEHISDPFFMLYEQYKNRVKDIEKYRDDLLQRQQNPEGKEIQNQITPDNQISNSSDQVISDQEDKAKDDTEANKELMQNLAMTAEQPEDENPNPTADPHLNLKLEFNVRSLSPYLDFDLGKSDKCHELPVIKHLPLKLEANQYFNPQFQQQFPQYQYTVERNNKDIDLSKVKDEFANGQEVDLKSIMSRIFLIDGRIYKHYHLLPWFPKYMELFYKSQLLLMDNNDGGDQEMENQSENDLFHKHINYYLAIMAVSCYKCEYLLYVLQEQFLLEGGPLEWLVFGLDKVDPKLRRIAELNEVLAFQPWRINKEHLHFLINGGQNQNENWTVHEVLKATTILATYHGLCGLCHGMGLIPDVDIVQELLGLMGSQALELISKDQYARRTSITEKDQNQFDKKNTRAYELSITDCDADVSSYTSRSQKSEGQKTDHQSERIFSILQQRTSRKKGQEYSSDSADESDKKDMDQCADDDSQEGSQREYGNEAEQVEAFREDIEQLNINDGHDDFFELDAEKDLSASNSTGAKRPSAFNQIGQQYGTSNKSSQPSSSKDQGKLSKKNLEESKITTAQKESGEEAKNAQETQKSDEKSAISEIFDKHRILKIQKHVDFKVKEDQYLDTYDFQWNPHGYDLFRKYVPVAAKLVTNQMNHAFNMTKMKFANKSARIDTSDFRNAIVYYLKEIHGIRDDQFKYKKINELFKIQQKIYIKKLMCNPQDITIEDYIRFSELLYDSEKCHVCILAMETKRQVSMVYVAKALQEFIS